MYSKQMGEKPYRYYLNPFEFINNLNVFKSKWQKGAANVFIADGREAIAVPQKFKFLAKNISKGFEISCSCKLAPTFWRKKTDYHRCLFCVFTSAQGLKGRKWQK